MTIVALFRLGFPVAPALKALTKPATVTRRVIMQKARRHPAIEPKFDRMGLRQLVGVRFQVLLTTLTGFLFTFHSRYLVHYRSPRST